MDVNVRRARIEDLDALIEMRRDVAAEGIWIGAELPLDDAGDREKFAATIAKDVDDPTGVMLVAMLSGGVGDGPDERIVGNLAMVNPVGIAGLGMNVAGGHRGRGIGAALVAAGIDWARDAGAHKIELQHWPWNHRARALYERFGFVEEGYLRRQWRRKDGSLWDAVVMGLVLDEEAPGHERRADEPPGR